MLDTFLERLHVGASAFSSALHIMNDDLESTFKDRMHEHRLLWFPKQDAGLSFEKDNLRRQLVRGCKMMLGYHLRAAGDACRGLLRRATNGWLRPQDVPTDGVYFLGTPPHSIQNQQTPDGPPGDGQPSDGRLTMPDESPDEGNKKHFLGDPGDSHPCRKDTASNFKAAPRPSAARKAAKVLATALRASEWVN